MSKNLPKTLIISIIDLLSKANLLTFKVLSGNVKNLCRIDSAKV